MDYAPSCDGMALKQNIVKITCVDNFCQTLMQIGGRVQGAGWFVLTSLGQTAADLIETGRRFERMALLARERGIGIHPMTQILEEKQGIEQLAAHHGSELYPQFVLRVGYLEAYPEPVSLRRPVDWFATI